MTQPLAILAAGGTGGHVFPAEALATELLRRGFRLALITDRRGTAYRGALGDIETHRLGVLAPVGGFGRKIASGVSLVAGVFAARRLLRRLAPQVVVGFGGYPSLAPMIAATRLGLPTLIHEQNAALGRANRMVARSVATVATSFPEVRLMPSGVGARLTGNPVRDAVIALRDRIYQAPAERLSILVTGGSQGASVFAKVVPAALAALPDAVRARVELVQQTRAEDIHAVRAACAQSGVSATLAPFFADLPERLGAAHLVICRSGASTVAELAVVGRPAILVPYPFAADDHQTDNARAFAAAGGGWQVANDAFTPAELAQRLARLADAPRDLATAASAARSFGRPDAAARLADLVASLAGANGHTERAA
ncbi:MAG: undecaprenyldiphospho-muramoylpentapeptide beta-N-acetylglucosaminyltransferase [Alphaproteobacteria bacterium]|nr:undecaprenyldiphospho-muramoylpentapeptide beta-N-acetylglucosaminyltransferase [Alphaproteobacteria bacterium]